jgi:hypothetical protein
MRDHENFKAFDAGRPMFFAFSFMEAIASKNKTYVRFFGAVVSPLLAIEILLFSAFRIHFVCPQRKQSCRRFEPPVSLRPLPVFKRTGCRRAMSFNAGQPNAGSRPSVMAGIQVVESFSCNFFCRLSMGLPGPSTA